MNEDFVPFELAVKLKEKGFREECFARYYCSDKAYCERNSYHPNTESIFYCYNNDEDLGRFYIDASTISQVLKWLRKEKKTHIIVEISDSGWYYTLYPNVRWENDKLKSDKYIMSFKHKASYEQAALTGIEYVLDNLI